MDFLRNLFGNLASGVIRLLVAIGILAATYVFIVKPVLNTTDNAIESANKSFERSFGTSLDLRDIGKTIENADKQVRVQIRRSLRTAKKQGKGDPQKLVRCIRRANGNVRRIRRCTSRF